MTVSLRPITKENWESVYWLSTTLTAEQQHFVAPNGYSMLEALFDSENHTSRAIYADETLVGYLMTEYDPPTHRHFVVRLMIGGSYQSKGYGRALMRLVIEEYKAKPDCDALYICFEPENHVARQFYESLGFVDTGKLEEEEMVFRLPLSEIR